MACILTINVPRDCRDGIGGLVRIYIVKSTDIASFTTGGTGGAVDLFTLVAAPSSATPFYQYDFETDSGVAEAAQTGDRPAGTSFWEHTITIPIAKQEITVRNEIKALAALDAIVIAETSNGLFWGYGLTRGLFLNGAGTSTGTAIGDANGYTLVLTGTEPDPELEVEFAAFSALINP